MPSSLESVQLLSSVTLKDAHGAGAAQPGAAQPGRYMYMVGRSAQPTLYSPVRVPRSPDASTKGLVGFPSPFDASSPGSSTSPVRLPSTSTRSRVASSGMCANVALNIDPLRCI